MQAPGRLLALDSPVSLKHSHGKGFNITFDPQTSSDMIALADLQRQYPFLTVLEMRGKYVLSTGTSDPRLVNGIISKLPRKGADPKFQPHYQVNSSTLEDVFLDLNAQPAEESPTPDVFSPPSSTRFGSVTPESASTIGSSSSTKVEVMQGSIFDKIEKSPKGNGLSLTPGQKRGFFIDTLCDTWTMICKRGIVWRRSWLLPLIGAIVVICAATIPLFFLSGDHQSCAISLEQQEITILTYPRSYFAYTYKPLRFAPASLIQDMADQLGDYVQMITDNSTFLQYIRDNINSTTLGGVSVPDGSTGDAVIAWEGSALVNKGSSMLNTLSNTLLDEISPVSDAMTIDNSFRINANFQYLPTPTFTNTAEAIKWLAFL